MSFYSFKIINESISNITSEDKISSIKDFFEKIKNNLELEHITIILPILFLLNGMVAYLGIMYGQNIKLWKFSSIEIKNIKYNII